MIASASLAVALLLGVAHAAPAESESSASRWHGGKKRQTYDLPLEDSPFGFLSKMSLGTPPTELTVFVDWTWIGHAVTTPRCYGSYNPGACMDANQITFDPRHSKTFQNLSSKYDPRSWKPNHFFFEDPLDVDYGRDRLQVGPVISDTVLQLTDIKFDQRTYGFAFPFSQIYGLSPVWKGDGKDYQSPFYQQLQQGHWKEARTGFIYCYEESHKKVCNGHDGIQTLGGIRSDLIANDKIWWYDVNLYPDVNTLDFKYDPGLYNYWGIELESLRIGNEFQKIERTSAESGKAAIFDHASYGNGLPLTPNAHAKLGKITNGVPINMTANPINNGPGPMFYKVDCNATDSFPDVAYKFAGHCREWVAKAKHYVAKTEDGTCVLNVRALASGDKFIGNFGGTFSKDKYVVLDFAANKVGLADIKW